MRAGLAVSAAYTVVFLTAAVVGFRPARRHELTTAVGVFAQPTALMISSDSCVNCCRWATRSVLRRSTMAS